MVRSRVEGSGTGFGFQVRSSAIKNVFAAWAVMRNVSKSESAKPRTWGVQHCASLKTKLSMTEPAETASKRNDVLLLPVNAKAAALTLPLKMISIEALDVDVPDWKFAMLCVSHPVSPDRWSSNQTLLENETP